jgi:hypothetical protein
MKKLLLATAIAASVASTGANAIAVESNITGLGAYIGSSNAAVTVNNEGGLAVGGDTVTGLTFTGNATLTTGPFVDLTFNLSDGVRSGVNGAGGTTFNSGTILINVDAGDGNGFQPYGTVDASVIPGGLPFLAGQDGHITGAPTQTTAGLVVDDSGNGTLGGLWNGGFLDVPGGWNSAASSLTLFGNTAGFFLEGTVSPSAVPVPAAAWLFGSALVGLAGIGRKRKAA